MSGTEATAAPAADHTPARASPFPVNLDAAELWVADLDRMQHRLVTRFGFTAARALPGGDATERAAALVNGGVRIILRQGSDPTSPVARHVARHGDTVADLALHCSDPHLAAERARAHGLDVTDSGGAPTIDMSGDGLICHTLRPEPIPFDLSGVPTVQAMTAIDHVAYCVPRGTADIIADAYQDVFDLTVMEGDSFDSIGDPTTGMRSVVVAGDGFTVVLTEPLSETGGGQTQQFINAHRGPGVQHAAVACADLFAAVEQLRRAGVDFLTIPALYYDRARQRLPDRSVDWETLQSLGILVDADHRGLLFQLFTVPLTDRGTFFFELIQRAGSTGFGANNVRALFEAVQASLANTADTTEPPERTVRHDD